MHFTPENPRYSMQGNSTHPHSDCYEHLEPSISDERIQSLSRQECTRFIPWITRTGMSPTINDLGYLPAYSQALSAGTSNTDFRRMSTYTATEVSTGKFWGPLLHLTTWPRTSPNKSLRQPWIFQAPHYSHIILVELIFTEPFQARWVKFFAQI